MPPQPSPEAGVPERLDEPARRPFAYRPRSPASKIARTRLGILDDGIARRVQRILTFFRPIFEDSLSMSRAPKAIVP
jgi:hypothetical protein